ncbi:hypothetical protein GCM10017786_01200 [Amycolatopsis deserti]|uniref:YD repeat-containing protein n=1 Tax=Amycolatopsis deserti TaxID=185696 RepID=A0ABQ3I9X1_9PSEU|nr:hypothetical protein GCM10017786_01200 [Amycolatopsis deserti]
MVNQGGMPKLTTSTTAAAGPARVDEQVYDASGRVIAEATGGAWTCTTYDVRDRPLEERVPASADAPARTVTHNYAVGGDPLTTSVSDDKGTITPPDPADAPRTLSFTNDDAGRVLTQKLDSTTVATVTKDYAARLTSLGWKTSDGKDIVSQVGRTSAGTIIDESLAGVAARPNAPNYIYDGVGRLTEAYVAGHHYTPDYTSTASATCPTGTQSNAGLNTNRMRLLDQTASGTARTRYCYGAADRLLATEGATALTNVVYDADGNTTSWRAADGTVTTLKWDGSDRNISAQTVSPTPVLNANVVYTRDATNRIIRRDPLNCDNNTVARYGYTGDSDTADLTLDGNNRLTSVSLSLPGGVLFTSKVGSDGAFTPTYDHPTVRGDLVLTTDAAGHQVGDLRTYDPYGQPLTAAGAVTSAPTNTPAHCPSSRWEPGPTSRSSAGSSPSIPRRAAPPTTTSPAARSTPSTSTAICRGWLKSAVNVVTKVAEYAAYIPGPIGAVANGVAAVGNAIRGNWGKVAVYAAGGDYWRSCNFHLQGG